MLKRISYILILAAIFVSTAGAALVRDAPFPIQAAKGTWISPEGVVVKLSVGAPIYNGLAVPYKIKIETRGGVVEAIGDGIQPLNNVRLVAHVKNTRGQMLKVVMRVGEPDGGRTRIFTILLDIGREDGSYGQHLVLGRALLN